MKKAYDDHGTDWLSLVVPPQNEDEGEYTINVHLTFMLSNWDCIFGRGCAGLFGVQDSQINPDAGCCTGSFWFTDKEDMDHVASMVEELEDQDWDAELREQVQKNGWKTIFDSNEATFNGKGKVFEGACVFSNRSTGSVGSTGKIGCAFHHLAQRTGREHVDVMPEVCWQLPLRFEETSDNTYELRPWDVSQWARNDYEFEDQRYICAWWCVDSPEAYVSDSAVYKTLEGPIRATIGDRPYELLVAAIEARLAAGNRYANMPGATRNEGRPLLPLLVGDREPRRPMPEYTKILDKMKDEANGNPD